MYINYGICVLALLVLAAEVWFVLKRNRQIKVKGKDDFFTFALVLLFCMALFPLDQAGALLESFRNVVLLMAVFGTLAIKRGVSDHGIEKLFFTVKWDQIREIRLEPYQMQKMILICRTDKRKWKLFFHRYQLRELLYQIQKYRSEVMLESSLEEALKYKKNR